MLNHGGAGGQYTNQNITNPYGTGYTHQEGNALLWEPLLYYSVFADKEVPWLARAEPQYNADYTELTIKLRPGIEWSDGKPITSKDVKYTLDTQKSNDKLLYHAQSKEFVKDVTAPDDMTVVVKFNSANPRFEFEVLSFKFDTGLAIVPEHIFKPAGRHRRLARRRRHRPQRHVQHHPDGAAEDLRHPRRTGGASRPASRRNPTSSASS